MIVRNGAVRKALLGLTAAAALAAAPVVTAQTADARGMGGGFRHFGGGFGGGGFRGGFHGGGWRRGGGWGWGGAGLGLGLAAGALVAGSYYGGYGPYYGYDDGYYGYGGYGYGCLRRAWGPYGPHLVRVC